MKNRIRSFKDPKMVFRRKAIANVPWLRNVNEVVVKKILEEIKIMRLREGGVILKRGDKTENLYIVLEGSVNVFINENNENELFDYLNQGSCFCAFTFLNPDGVQIMNFEAREDCVIGMLSREQIYELEN